MKNNVMILSNDTIAVMHLKININKIKIPYLSISKILIMNNTAINNNFSIIADKTSITIEENCLIGPNLFITDSDFHGLEVENRNNGNYVCLPVHIGKNVFIGENVRILKGVHIGDGAVIGNSSLVIKNVPAHTVYAGNPAKFIKKLLTSEKE